MDRDDTNLYEPPAEVGVNAAGGFAYTSAGLVRSRLNWIESMPHWTPALYSWPWERQE